MSNDKVIDCCNYIKSKNLVKDEACLKKIIELTKWIFLLDNTTEWIHREKGKSVVFFLINHKKDHFTIFKLQDKYAQMDLYISTTNKVILPQYIKRYVVKPPSKWARISGEIFSSLSKEKLQKHIRDSYHLRLDELGRSIDKDSPSSFGMADPITNEENDPTIEEFENFLRSSSQNCKVSIDVAFDAFEQQCIEDGQPLKSGWRQRLEEKLNQSRKI